MCARNVTHAIPTPDTREHILSVECWCQPVEGNGVWSHRHHFDCVFEKAMGLNVFKGFDCL